MIDAEKYDWAKLSENEQQCKDIRKDVSTARGMINNAMLQYIKRKTGVRNKAQAADMALAFKDLDDYNSVTDIQDAYGWEFITEKECDRLIDLWEKREHYVADSGKFTDRVTEMLTRAMNGIGEEYLDFLTETEAAKSVVAKQKKDIEKANTQRNYEKYIESVRSDKTGG